MTNNSKEIDELNSNKQDKLINVTFTCNSTGQIGSGATYDCVYDISNYGFTNIISVSIVSTTASVYATQPFHYSITAFDTNSVTAMVKNMGSSTSVTSFKVFVVGV